MSEGGYFLTEADLAFLRELAETHRQKVHNVQNRPFVDEPDTSSPEVYVAITPAGGIPALVGLIPGFADCQIYRILQDSLSIAPGAVYRRVYNLTTSAIAGSTIIQTKRDKYGTWLAEPPVVASSGGSGHPYFNSYRQVGTSPFERWYYAGQAYHWTLTTTYNTSVTQILLAIPFDSTVSGVLDSIGVRFTGGNGTPSNFRLGIYRATGSGNWYPSSLVYDSGDLAVPGLGPGGIVKATGLSISLSADSLYWFAFCTNAPGAVPMIGISTSGSLNPTYPFWGMDSGFTQTGVWLELTQSYGALLDPFPSGAVVTTSSTSPQTINAMPLIGCHYSS